MSPEDLRGGGGAHHLLNVLAQWLVLLLEYFSVLNRPQQFADPTISYTYPILIVQTRGAVDRKVLVAGAD